MFFCYILRNKQEQYKYLTYNGFTNNPKRRLRQHNEEIKGGARYTHGKGGGWEIYALLSGFHTNINALSCEWLIKHPSGKPGKREKKFNGPEGRIKSLNRILQLDQWTSKCLISNKDCQYKLHIAADVAHLLTELPRNIEVVVVDQINLDEIDIVSEKYASSECDIIEKEL
jgi:structure-specific endonuclease subunit SLX1